MRESPAFEVRLLRFDVWRCMRGAAAAAALAAVPAWAVAPATSAAESGIAVVASIPALPTAAALALSLARVRSGTLSCRDGEWSFTADGGPKRSGALTVAIDGGPFLLIRLEPRPGAHICSPVQRRDLEREWHALGCAVYSPPRHAGTAATAAILPPE